MTRQPTRNGIGERIFRLCAAALLVLLFVVAGLLIAPKQSAEAATSSNLNFQARLLNNSGAIVPDGNYNVEFKIFNASTSSGSSQGSCTGDVNCLWTETRTGGNTVRVVNGYLTVNLGSVTSFPAINWDQDMWLTMNIGGTGAASWDGELAPRIKLTAVPYAFKAGQLAKLTGGNTSTLDFAAQTGAHAILLPDEAGTLCIQNSVNCGFVVGAATNFIQNGTGLQTNANFNIQSAAAGSVAAIIQGASGQSSDLLQLKTSTPFTVLSVSATGQVLSKNSVDSTTAFAIQNAAGTSNLFVADTTNTRIGIGAAPATSVLTIGTNTTTAAGGLTFGTDTGLFREASNVLRTTGQLSVDGSLVAYGDLITHGTNTFQNYSNSTAAFQVQNAAGSQLFNIDNSTTPNLLTNPSIEQAIAGNWTAKGTTPTTFAQDATQSYIGSKSLKITTQATAGQGATQTIALTNGTTYFLSFMAKLDSGSNAFATLDAGFINSGSDTTCTLNSTTVVTTGWTRYTCSFTAGASSTAIYIKQTDGVIHTWYVDAVQLQLTANTPYQDGLVSINGVINSPTAFRNQSDSTTAFQIQNTAGTSNLFVADSVNNRIGIGKAPTGGYQLDVAGSIGSQTRFVINSSATSGGTLTKKATIGSGGVNANDVVVMNGSSQAVQTTTARDGRIYGVSLTTTGSGSTAEIALVGTITVNADSAAVSIGDQLVTSTTAGRVTVDNNATTGILGVALTSKAGGSTGAVDVALGIKSGQYSPTFRNAADSTTALQVQNAAGNAFVTADSTNKQLVLGKASTIDGTLQFLSASGSGSVSLVAANPGSTAYSLILPAENGTVCTTAGSAACITAYGGGSGSFVNFAPSSVQADATTNNSIFINKTTGTGNLLELQRAAADAFVVGNTGNTTITNTSTNAALQLTQTGNTSSSVSTGGAFNLNNTSNTGAGLVVYSNQSSPSGRLAVFNAANATFNQDVLRVENGGTGSSISINQTNVGNGGNGGTGLTIASDAGGGSTSGTHGLSVVLSGSGNTNASAANFVSANTASSAVQISGTETGRGTLKITHTGTGTDGNASGLSIDLAGSGTAAQGIFLDATGGGTTGKLLNLRNNGTELLTLDASGNLGLGVSGSPTAKLDVRGTALFQNTTNSTTAFQVQNASGSQLLNIDTTNSNLVTNPSFETNFTGWGDYAARGSTLSRVTNQQFIGNGSLQVVAPATANSGADYTHSGNFANATTFVATAYIKASGSNFSTFSILYSQDGAASYNGCTSGGTNVTVTTSGWTQVSCTFTTTTSTGVGHLAFIHSDGVAHSFFVDGVQLLVAGAATPYREGTIALNGIINSPTTFQNQSDSTTAFQIQGASGTNQLFVVDTLNSRVAIGAQPAATGATLQVSGDISTNQRLAINNSSANNGYVSKSTQVGAGGVTASDVVVLNSSNQAVQTTTARDIRIYGVAVNTTSSGNTTPVVLTGNFQVNYDTSSTTPAIGDQLVTSTVAGKVTVDNNATTGILGTATSAGSAGVVSVSVRPVNGQNTPIFRNAADSTTAFQIQNAAGSRVLGVDTTTTNLVPNSSVEQAIAGNWTNHNAGAVVSKTGAQSYIGSSSLQVVTTATAADGAKIVVPTLAASTTYNISWYDRLSSGSFSAVTSGYSYDGTAESNCTSLNVANSFTGGWTRHTCQFTTGSGATAPTAANYISIKQTDTTIRTFFVDAVMLVASANLNNQYRETAIQLDGLVNSALNIQPAADSTSALSVTSANGSSTVLSVDTLNTGVCINCKIPSFTLDVNGQARVVTSVLSPLFDAVVAGNLNIGTGTATTLNIGSNGATNPAINIDSGTSAINIGTGAQARTTNIGTGAAVQAVTLGSTNSTSTLTLQGGNGAGAVSIQAAASGTISVGTTNANTVNIGNATAATVFSAEAGTGTTALFNGATAHTIQLATGAAVQTVTVGSTNSTSTLTLQGGNGAGAVSIQAAASGTISLGTTNNNNIAIGTAAVAGTITVGGTNTTGQLTLGQSTDTNTISIGSNNSLASGKTQTINLGTSTGAGSITNVNIGSSIGGTTAITGPTTVTNRTSGSSDTFVVNNSTSTGTIAKFQDNGLNVFQIADGGGVTFSNTSNSKAAFVIQNANGSTDLFLADTTNNNVLGNTSFESGIGSWGNKAGCTLTRNTTIALYGTSSGDCTNTATANAGFTYSKQLTASTTYTFLFFAESSTASANVLSYGYQQNGGGEDVGGLSAVNQTITSTGWNKYVLTFTTGGTTAAGDYLYIKQSDATARDIYIDGITVEATGGLSAYTEGKLQLNGYINSPTIFKNQGDNNAAFQIQTAGGNGLFTVDTLNTTLYLGSTVSSTLASTVNIGTTGNATGTQTVNIGSNAKTNNGVSIDAGNTGTIAIGNTSSAHTINIGAASGANNTSVSIGSGVTGGSNTSVVTVGSSNAAASTTTIQGGNGAGAISIQAATSGTISLGTTNANTVNIGNTTGATGIAERVGTGNYSLDGVAGSTYQFGASTTTGTIAIGGTAQTGTLTLGQSTATNIISIGSVAGNGNTQTINLGTSATAGSTTTVNIGSTIAGVTTLQSQGGVKLTTQGAATANSALLCRDSSTFLLTACSSTGVGAVIVEGGNTFGAGVIIGSNDSNSLSFETNNVTQATIAVGGATTFQNSANNAAAFQVQNASGTSLFNIDTSVTNLLANPSVEQAIAGNWAQKGSATVTLDATQKYIGNDSLKVVTTAVASDGALQAFTFSAVPYNLTVYAKLDAGSNAMATFEMGYKIGAGADTSCLTAQSLLITGWTRFSCNFTPSAGAGSVYFKQTDGVIHTYYLDAMQLVASSFSLPYREGNISLNGVVNSPVTLQNQSDSTTAFQIQNSAGTSNLFIADTINGRIGIGTAAPAQTLDVNGSVRATLLRSNNGVVNDSSSSNARVTTGTTGTVIDRNIADANVALIVQQIHASSTGDIFQAKNNSSTVFQIAQGGNITASGTYNTNTFNSSTLQFGAAGTATVDSASGQTLQIGTGANAHNVIVGNTTGASNLSLQAGTSGSLNIGSVGSSTLASTIHIADTSNGTGVQTVTIGSPNNSSNSVTLESGDGGTINIGNFSSTHTVNISNNSGTSNSTVGIGSGTTGSGVSVVTIGSQNAAASTTTIQGGNTGAAVSIQAGAGGSVNIASSNNNNLYLGTAATTGIVQIGGTGAQTGTIDLGVGTGVQAINLGTGGTGAKTVTLGSSASTGVTTIQSGGGITLNSGNGNITSNNQVQRAVTRTLPTVVNDEVDIGSIAIANGANTLLISIVVPSTNFSVSKYYQLPIDYNQTNNVWVAANPVSDTGPYSGNDYKLDVNVNNGVTSLRIRRTAGSTAGTAYVTIIEQGLNSNVFTPSSATSSVAAPTGFLNNTLITQVNNSTTIQGNNTTAAFQIQNSTSAILLKADTTNNRIVIGDADNTSSANTTAFILDSSSTTNQPAGTNGAMYYDVTKGHVQCYESGAWGDCGNTTLQNAYTNSSPATITTSDNKDLSFVAADTTTDSSIIFNLQCTTCSANGGRFAVQNAATDVFIISPNSGAATHRVITDTATAFQVQNANGAMQVSVDTTNTGSSLNLALNSGAEAGAGTPTSWAAHGSATLSRDTTAGEFASGLSSAKAANTGATQGVRNNVGTGMAASTTYSLSFSIKVSAALTNANLTVRFSPDGTGSNNADCVAGTSNPTITTANFIKYTCVLTTTSTTTTASAYLAIFQADATTRNIFIDNLYIVAQNATGTQNVGTLRLGGSSSQGLTLLTLDTFAGNPFTGTNTALAGSMYFDTTAGKIQCYDGTQWGACGAAPNSIVTLTPEYTGAVLNGTGIGTLISDFCANSGALTVGSLCGSNDARNFYKWTSPQATLQEYDMYVTYKLPNTFKNFLDNNTISLTARSDGAVAATGLVTFEVYKSTGSAITACGTETTVTTADNTWQTVLSNGNENTTCAFAAGNNVIFKIRVKAKSSANVYVENLNFTYTNQ